MNKDDLKGKYVKYIDKNGAYRIGRVTKINGRTLTVKGPTGERERIHPDKNKIFGRQLKTKVEEIEWN